MKSLWKSQVSAHQSQGPQGCARWRWHHGCMHSQHCFQVTQPEPETGKCKTGEEKMIPWCKEVTPQSSSKEKERWGRSEGSGPGEAATAKSCRSAEARLCSVKAGYLNVLLSALRAPEQLVIAKSCNINSPRAKFTLNKTQVNLTLFS